jgi:phage-related protein
MKYKFRVIFLEEANEFLEGLDEKAKEKILYNIWKVRMSYTNDKVLFKKLRNEIWEFRTLHNKTCYRFFAFWDKSNKADTLVVSTHGIVKKTDKINEAEIDKANNLREKYFNEKEKK